MNNLMTFFTKCNSIRYIKNKFRIIFNWFYMMRINNIAFMISTFLASIIIPFKNGFPPSSIFRGSPISLFLGSIFTVFIPMMSLATFSIHWIIGTIHPFSLLFNSRVCFFGQAVVPGWFSFKNFRCLLSKFTSSLIIIFPLELNSFMGSSLFNVKQFQCFRNYPIRKFEFLGNFSDWHFIYYIPLINKFLPRLRMLARCSFESLYKLVFVMTALRTITIFRSLFNLAEFTKESLVAIRANKILSTFHNIIISQKQVNLNRFNWLSAYIEEA